MTTDAPTGEPSKQCAPAFSAPKLRITIIVCTRNRRRALMRSLDSIERAACAYDARLIELIVVNNASVDDTREHLSSFVQGSRVSARAIDKPEAGLARARNAGLRQATGEVIAFIDDDCTLSEDYFVDLAQLYAAPPFQIIRGGRVELGEPEDFELTVKTTAERERYRPAVPPGGFVLGCNLTMHRDVAERIGPFDERFGAGGPLRSAEDTDYFVRAHRLGVPIEYVPRMSLVHHHGRQDRRAVVSCYRDYNFGNGALYAKHLFAAPWLIKHFLWTVRSGLQELWGGARFDTRIGLSNWDVVSANLAGAAKFLRLKLAASIAKGPSHRAPRETHAHITPPWQGRRH